MTGMRVERQSAADDLLVHRIRVGRWDHRVVVTVCDERGNANERQVVFRRFAQRLIAPSWARKAGIVTGVSWLDNALE